MKSRVAYAKVAASAFDIVVWFSLHKETGCPYCGRSLKDMAPEENLFPHFVGGCKPEAGDSGWAE